MKDKFVKFAAANNLLSDGLIKKSCSGPVVELSNCPKPELTSWKNIKDGIWAYPPDPASKYLINVYNKSFPSYTNFPSVFLSLKCSTNLDDDDDDDQDDIENTHYHLKG